MPRSDRFLIVSFDGLRPDLIDAAQTPNLARLKALGTTLARHRTVYPSETRVAFPSFVTGTTASGHGMVGNKYIDRESVPQRYLDTSDAVLLQRLDRESGGRLMSASTLGETLAAAGRSLAVLATNTPGTTRLFHHKAEAFGHVRLSGHFPEACAPADVLAAVEARFGKLPPAPGKGEPDFEGQTLITSILLEKLWPESGPDVTILSYGEPDTTSHFHGTGAERTREIIAHCDREFGRVLDWWEAEGRDRGVQLMAISDHGHVTAHSRVSVLDRLRAAGFAPGAAPGPDVDVVVVPGQVGGLYVTDRSPAQLERLTAAITAEPWCGPVFSAPKNEVEGIVPGTFSRHLVFAEHVRSPDLYFAFRADDGVDPFGLVGGTWYDNDRRSGLGVHGGLHPKELAAVGIVAGSAFRAGHISEVPSGIADLAPTLLDRMGVPAAASMTGRVLAETFAEPAPVPVTGTETFETGRGAWTQSLRRVRVGSHLIIDGGWIGAPSNP